MKLLNLSHGILKIMMVTEENIGPILMGFDCISWTGVGTVAEASFGKLQR